MFGAILYGQHHFHKPNIVQPCKLLYLLNLFLLALTLKLYKICSLSSDRTISIFPFSSIFTMSKPIFSNDSKCLLKFSIIFMNLQLCSWTKESFEILPCWKFFQPKCQNDFVAPVLLMILHKRLDWSKIWNKELY